MNTKVISVSFLTVLLLAGCANHNSQVFSLEQEIAQGKKTALAAVNSTSAWERVEGRRITGAPLRRVDASQVRYRFYDAKRDAKYFVRPEQLVVYEVPTGLRFGIHSTFIEVAVLNAREVLGMSESFYP
jgi:hypothetical protein